MTLKKVNLHPASCKYLKLGHPWITEDSYTKRFPRDDFFLIGVDEKTRQEMALIIHDPEHKNVKARLWSLNPEDWKETLDFNDQLRRRLSLAFKKRMESQELKERENYFLVNGESDLLPGLLILKLKNQLVIQYYALFWKKVESTLLSLVESLIDVEEIWIQERNFNQTKSFRSVRGLKSDEFTLSEYGVHYLIRINENYDLGIYTDMSAIRFKLAPYLSKVKSMLNLYSYTGAFSLYGLSLGMERVVSVDLSSKYLSWLEENLNLNPTLNKKFHTSFCMPSEKALTQLVLEGAMFESIICDPPSASSDGNSMSTALKSYEKLLPLMLKVLAKNGILFVFLNTHHISWNKFEEKLKTIIEGSEFKNQLNIGKRFKLSDDCSPLKGFHEGDYLKGFMIEFKNKGV